jgi:hypothetical protein
LRWVVGYHRGWAGSGSDDDLPQITLGLGFAFIALLVVARLVISSRGPKSSNQSLEPTAERRVDDTKYDY